MHCGTISSLVLAASLSVVVAGAQTPPTTVAAAEADGAMHAKPDASAQPAALYGEAFGPTDRRCVDAETHVTARSGEFVAGPFETHIMFPSLNGPRRKVWWAPRQTAGSGLVCIRCISPSRPERCENAPCLHEQVSPSGPETRISWRGRSYRKPQDRYSPPRKPQIPGTRLRWHCRSSGPQRAA
jgi:hypothetical protein